MEVKIRGGGRGGRATRKKNQPPSPLTFNHADTSGALRPSASSSPHGLRRFKKISICTMKKKKAKIERFSSSCRAEATPSPPPVTLLWFILTHRTLHEPPGHQSIVPGAPSASLSLSFPPSLFLSLSVFERRLVVVVSPLLSSQVRQLKAEFSPCQADGNAVQGKRKNEQENRNSVLSPQSTSHSADAGEGGKSTGNTKIYR